MLFRAGCGECPLLSDSAQIIQSVVLLCESPLCDSRTAFRGVHGLGRGSDPVYVNSVYRGHAIMILCLLLSSCYGGRGTVAQQGNPSLG